MILIFIIKKRVPRWILDLRMTSDPTLEAVRKIVKMQCDRLDYTDSAYR
jgi:hypothetical protein